MQPTLYSKFTVADSMAGHELRCAFLANHHMLIKKLDTEALLPDCISHGLVTLEEQELISREATGSQKTDRLLTIIHRRGQLNPDVFDKFLELLSDGDVTSGQLLDEVVKQIRANSVDPEVQARFANELDGDKPLSLHSIEDKIIKTLTVNEVLPQLISHGVVSIQENELIRSRSQEEEKAKELLKIIRHGGKSAYDVFVEVLLQSETQASLGEWLKEKAMMDDRYDQTSAASQVLNSEKFHLFLAECEESVNQLMNKFMAEVATKFYTLGFQEGGQAAIKSTIPSSRIVADGDEPLPSDELRSTAIAVQLKVMTDELPKDIQEDTRVALIKLFQETSVFLINRESFRAICASILVKNHQLFPTGWHQIALIYYAMFQVVLTIKQESGDVPTETRELQVINFVGPTLVDLGLYSWMEKHGGMEKFGSPVEDEDATVVIKDS